jgi:site-specific DNA-methyltransferase (adenine-specific)
METAVPHLPRASFDLLFLDPPYNLRKTFGRRATRPAPDWGDRLSRWLDLLAPLLKPDASAYLCGHWPDGADIQRAAERVFTVRNRITWEREKGRGARANWKNASEDIWFCTVGKRWRFDPAAVKLRRRVLAPYRVNGRPKDWEEGPDGHTRLTHPSNLWTDLTVPFWSMPENTDHPAQKPEKLVAKLLLASTAPGDAVLDPFLGAGTTAAVCAKLGRRFTGIEQERRWALLAARRVELARADRAIQGFADGVFWERNSRPRK